METLRQDLQVRFHYEVHFTRDLFAVANPLLRSILSAGESARVLAVVDEGLLRATPGLQRRIESYFDNNACAELVCAPLALPGGELAKNSDQYVHRVHAAIFQHKTCRHSYVLAVGGGAVLDAAGYAAATAHRGVRLIRVPTTVLAQNDSGVGVKNGINAFGTKNFLGCFAPPYAVLNDFEFLKTLPERDWRAGIAEAIKVALIKDYRFFDFIEGAAARLRARDMAAMEKLIYRCAELHVAHIAAGGDPFEIGSSRPLDFGHWAAHKLEALTEFRLRHGEAVAIGMALDATYSRLSGLLSHADWRRILDLLLALGFQLHVPELDRCGSRDDPASLLSGLASFREHLGGRLTVMLLNGIGRSVEVHELNDERIQESIDLLRERPAAPAPALLERRFHDHLSSAHAPDRGGVFH